MSIQSVKDFLASRAPDLRVLESAASTATVALAAEAHGVVPGQIAKTLSFRVDGKVILIVIRGDARLDNRKYKARFGTKARMLDSADVEAETGHPVGGVCPFAVPPDVAVYCDVSLRAFDEVLPAAGAVNAAVRVAPQRMADLVGAEWVDVAQSVVTDSHA